MSLLSNTPTLFFTTSIQIYTIFTFKTRTNNSIWAFNSSANWTIFFLSTVKKIVDGDKICVCRSIKNWVQNRMIRLKSQVRGQGFECAGGGRLSRAEDEGGWTSLQPAWTRGSLVPQPDGRAQHFSSFHSWPSRFPLVYLFRKSAGIRIPLSHQNT